VVADRDADEDDRAAATNALLELALRPEDCVVAVSASGSTPFVLAALEAARDVGALGIAVAGARGSKAAALADHEVVVAVGPEVVAGSTRLKAGTAQKLVLNTISTVTMIRLGRTYGGLMIGVAPGNEKLRQRARRNVVLASGAPEERVDEALEAAAGDARVALVALLAGVDADAARERLEARRLGPEGAEADEARVRGRARPRRARAGRRRRSTDGVVVAVGLPGACAGRRGSRLRRPAGERLRRCRLPLRLDGDYDRAGEASARRGVTAFQPTFITSAEAATSRRSVRCRRSGRRRASSAPMSRGRSSRPTARHPPARASRAPGRRAARPASRRGQRDADDARAGAAGARVRSSSVRSERGVVVSAGHTNATAAQAHIGLRPRRLGRHPRLQRDAAVPLARPGVAGAALTRRDVFVQMIVDGYHLADETVRLVWACAAGRVALVTDAMPARAAATGLVSSSATSRSRSSRTARPMREDGRSRDRCSR
jgi:hypothetical protein